MDIMDMIILLTAPTSQLLTFMSVMEKANRSYPLVQHTAFINFVGSIAPNKEHWIWVLNVGYQVVQNVKRGYVTPLEIVQHHDDWMKKGSKGLCQYPKGMPPVLWLLSLVIADCQSHGITASFCGGRVQIRNISKESTKLRNELSQHHCFFWHVLQDGVLYRFFKFWIIFYLDLNLWMLYGISMNPFTVFFKN